MQPHILLSDFIKYVKFVSITRCKGGYITMADEAR